MKKNSKKLFLWLNNQTKDETWFSVTELMVVLPTSSASLRALLKLHEGSGLLLIDSTVKNWRVKLTQAGREVAKDLFPVFSDRLKSWDGVWSLIVFREAPSGDKQFRYLREQLVNIGAGALARGVYLYPGGLPSQVTQMLRSLYSGKAVHCVTISEWQLGSYEAVINEIFKLSDIATIYSGISNELFSLLEKASIEKGLNQGQKKYLNSVFNRFFETIEQDLGLTAHFFPQVAAPQEILHQMYEFF